MHVQCFSCWWMYTISTGEACFMASCMHHSSHGLKDRERLFNRPLPKQNMGSLASSSPTSPSAARFWNFSCFSSSVHANSWSHTCMRTCPGRQAIIPQLEHMVVL